MISGFLIGSNCLIFSVGIFGTGWHTAEGDISSAYRSFSNQKIFGRMGIYIGLNQVTDTFPEPKNNEMVILNFFGLSWAVMFKS